MYIRLGSLLLVGALTLPALAAKPALTVTVEGIGADGVIEESYALCKATKDGKSEPGLNKRPTIEWSGSPITAKSYAILVIDPDVPTDFSDAGKDGRVVRDDAKRQQFFHWALVDIPAGTLKISGGDANAAPTVGKSLPGDLGSYIPDPKNFGGPCPPWNDERVHHYHFTVLALDVETLKLPEKATAKDVLAAAGGHILARGERVGTYTLNPLLRKSGAPK